MSGASFFYPEEHRKSENSFIYTVFHCKNHHSKKNKGEKGMGATKLKKVKRIAKCLRFGKIIDCVIFDDRSSAVIHENKEYVKF